MRKDFEREFGLNQFGFATASSCKLAITRMYEQQRKH
jgi:hypothetical protein